MTDLWPWLTAAGAGALHGLHPAGGWVLGAAWSLRWRGGGRAHQVVAASVVALCLLLALHDAGRTMAPLLWGLCLGTPAGSTAPGAASWALAASLIAVHAGAWLTVSALLAACARHAARRWRMRAADKPHGRSRRA